MTTQTHGVCQAKRDLTWGRIILNSEIKVNPDFITGNS
jgi:hypothetical protein